VLLKGPQPVHRPTQPQLQLQRTSVQPAAPAHAEARAGPRPVPAAVVPAVLPAQQCSLPTQRPRAGPHNSCSCGSAARAVHCVQRPGWGCLDAAATYAMRLHMHAWGAAWGDVAGARKQAGRREGGPAGRQRGCQHHASQPHTACYTLQGSVGLSVPSMPCLIHHGWHQQGNGKAATAKG
jgi:hypothetical protein